MSAKEVFVLCFIALLCQASGQCRRRQCTDGKCETFSTCQRLSRCPTALTNLKNGVQPQMCGGYEEGDPNVCCMTTATIETTEAASTTESEIFYTEISNTTTHISKSEQMCKHYGKTVFELRRPATLMGGSKPRNTSLCGVPAVAPLIVGGTKAKAGEFPHMVILGYGSQNNIQWLCGGALVSERHVLTAAHCVEDSRPPFLGGLGNVRWARIGDLDLFSNDDGVQPQQFRIVGWKIHPNYKPPQKYNDIGILTLDRNATFSKYVRPACLHHSKDIPGDGGIATGWGQTAPDGPSSDTLMKVKIPLVSQKECNSKFIPDASAAYKRALPDGIVETMLCAGEKEGGKDTCKGDSGGPLQILLDSPYCMYSIIGVTSFGRSCAEPDTPGIYTRVSAYLKWIEETVWGW